MSRVDDIVTAIAARMDDSTVSFEAGKLRLNEHAQQRRVIVQRTAGVLGFSSGPGRRPHSSGTGTEQRFVREETLRVTLRAEDEEALDALFDRFVNAVFEQFGPNALEDETPYSWHGEDSDQGGSWLARNPAITLTMTVRLRSRSDEKPYATVADGSVEVTELDSTVTVPAP